MICDKCGKEFTIGNRPDGLPNGLSFVLTDGTQITYCTDCIINQGADIRQGGATHEES